MSVSALAADERVAVETTENELKVRLMDGRTISVPLVWYPECDRRTKTKLARCERRIRHSLGRCGRRFKRGWIIARRARAKFVNSGSRLKQRRTEQINGRERQTTTFLKTLSVKL